MFIYIYLRVWVLSIDVPLERLEGQLITVFKLPVRL
jgi:hypothetical protein